MILARAGERVAASREDLRTRAQTGSVTSLFRGQYGQATKQVIRQEIKKNSFVSNLSFPISFVVDLLPTSTALVSP